MAHRNRDNRPEARVERARALLGQEADPLTDAEVLEVDAQAKALASVIVRMYLESKHSERVM